jgi:TRAP-type C4-dicarboxylate transport system permease large subunit
MRHSLNSTDSFDTGVQTPMELPLADLVVTKMIADLPLLENVRSAIPMLAILLAGLLIVTCVPWFSLVLPHPLCSF